MYKFITTNSLIKKSKKRNNTERAEPKCPVCGNELYRDMVESYNYQCLHCRNEYMNLEESTDKSYVSVFKPRKRKKSSDVKQVEVMHFDHDKFKPVKFAYHDVLNRKGVTVQADTEQRYNELKTALNARLENGTIRNLKESRY